MVDISKFGKGALHKSDGRDFIFGAERVQPYDWSKSYTFDYKSIITSIRNQNGSSSCVGQTEAEVVDILLEAFGHSARYTYSQIHLDSGGAYVRDALSLGAKQVIQMLRIVPDDPQTESHMRDTTGIEIKNRNIPHTYATVNTDIESVAVAIRDHKAVHLAVQGDNLGWATAYPIPPSKPTWGHDLCALEPVLKGGKKYIKVLNSWGSGWGENGYGYISEDYFNSGNVTVCMVYTDNYYEPKPLIKKNMKAFQLAGSPDVYVPVLDTYVWIQDMDTFVSLGGTTEHIIQLPKQEFDKLGADKAHAIHKV